MQGLPVQETVQWGSGKLRSRFWLYFGIFLACSGFGTAAGVVILLLYFWEDIRHMLDKKNPNYTVHFYDESQKKSGGAPFDGPKKHYSDDTLDEMR